MNATNPYLIFQGDAHQAFHHYRALFGGEFRDGIRFADMQDPGSAGSLSEADMQRLAHIALPLANGTVLMGSDTPSAGDPDHVAGNNVYVLVEFAGADEARRAFDGLAEGGRVHMDLQKTEWAEGYGTCTDRFGIRWMVMAAGA